MQNNNIPNSGKSPSIPTYKILVIIRIASIIVKLLYMQE